MRTILIITGALMLTCAAQTQTLFTYGNQQVSADEFIRAFKKNVEPGTVTEASVRNYLDLYTRFKLKVQDAYNMKLDTLVNKQEDIAAFRTQIEDQFMYDSVLQEKMLQEAKQRGTKEIRISHILIPFKEEFAAYPQIDVIISAADRERAKAKAEKAYAKLAAGEDFGKVALEFSSDSSVRLNRGDLGYITVFTLPYSLENEAYALSASSISRLFASDKGYHIFKQTGERPASGVVQAQQILIAYDQEAGTGAKLAAKQLADSLYQALLKGASFEALARGFSFDAATAPNGGSLPPLSVGTYDPVFEEKLFALSSDGQIAPPFETTMGFHIIKRIQQTAPDANSFKGTTWSDAFARDARGNIPRKVFAQKTVKVTGMKVVVTDMKELFRFTDSTLKGRRVFSTFINEQTILLKFPERNLNTKDWLGYVQSRAHHSTQEEYEALWNDFRNASSAEYYRAHMASLNPAFRAQITEFIEGNMLFEAMERKVWSKAATDTAELRSYYNSNKAKYQWGKSADVIMFSASDSLTASNARNAIIKNPGGWRQLMETSGGRIMADSSRMEWKLVQAENAPMKNNTATTVMVNREDQSATFAYILKTYPKSTTKRFDEARVQVVNDYQQVLEERWIDGLRKQYPIVVNDATFKQVLNTLQR
jgi:peptidyl-prolyl cis-trans isomerase SurA